MGNNCYKNNAITQNVPQNSEIKPPTFIRSFSITTTPREIILPSETDNDDWNIMPFEKKFEVDSTFIKDISSNIRNMSNHYSIHYPEHKKRVETTIFRHTKKELENMPCFICGKCKVDDNISNEIHHYFIQKVAASAIDWIKFGEFAEICYNIQTGILIGDKFDWKEVEKNPDIFVDSPYNMIVLCKNHHTGRCGIHHVPYPDWILQKFAIEGFKFVI